MGAFAANGGEMTRFGSHCIYGLILVVLCSLTSTAQIMMNDADAREELINSGIGPELLAMAESDQEKLASTINNMELTELARYVRLLAPFRRMPGQLDGLPTPYARVNGLYFGIWRKYVDSIHEARLQEVANAAPPFLAAVDQLAFNALNYPYVDGSTSAQPLGKIIACRLLDVPYTWVPWGEEYDEATTRSVLTKPRTREEKRIALLIDENLTEFSGTHTAYESLIRRTRDLVLVARQPSNAELNLARELDVSLDVKPIARDALVFIVNGDNAVTSLDVSDLQSIYAPHPANWADHGGEDAAIVPYTREANSGSIELMTSLVMHDRPMVDAKKLTVFTMGGPFNALVHDKYGISFSVYYYEHFIMVAPYVKVIAVNGVFPGRTTISDGTYPLIAEVFSAIRADLPAEHNARKLRDWLLSQEGQQVIAESGYVSIGNP